MVHATDLAAGFVLLSAVIGLVLLTMALRAFFATHNKQMLFLASAFLVFTMKSVVVGAALRTGTPGHETLELVDAIGDLATILLLVAPVFLPRKHP